MKSSESLFKRSLPCPVALDFSRAAAANFTCRVRRATVAELKNGSTGELIVLYDGRPKPLPVQTELFEQSRKRAYESWKQLIPHVGDTFDPEIRHQQEEYMARVAVGQVSNLPVSP
jgi:hypothetical protein